MTNSKSYIYICVFIIILLIIILTLAFTGKASSNSDNKSYDNKYRTSNSKLNEELYAKYNLNSIKIENLDIKTAWQTYQGTHLMNMQLDIASFKKCLYTVYLITKVGEQDRTADELHMLSLINDDNFLNKIKNENYFIFKDMFGGSYEYEKYLLENCYLFTINWDLETYEKFYMNQYFKQMMDTFKVIILNNASKILPPDLKYDVCDEPLLLYEKQFTFLEIMLFNWILYIRFK